MWWLRLRRFVMSGEEIKSLKREVREIRTIQFVPGYYADITLEVGDLNNGQAVDIYRVTFPNPRRVDVFSDENFNESYCPEWSEVTLAFPDFPDVYETPKSKYLQRYKNLEKSGKSLRHFVIHTDANGMIHVLTHHPPVLTSFPDWF